MKFIVETSARHVHVTQEDLETLFGKGYELTKKKDLSQPGQFACEERGQDRPQTSTETVWETSHFAKAKAVVFRVKRE